MKLVFAEQAWDDYLYWQAQAKRLLQRVNALIRECLRTPFSKTGKPEPLRGDLRGWGCRRITKERRLVYRVESVSLYVAQCGYHY
jgi:toxin YoeB